LYDWREVGSRIAPPRTLQHSRYPRLVECCFDKAELSAHQVSEAVVEAEERAHVGLNVCVLNLEAANDGKTDGIVGDTGPAEPRNNGDHFDGARVAKQRRAATIARLINELSVLKPAMPKDEGEYARLSESHLDFLTFKIAQHRPDLKQKIVVIRSSSKHIRLAQELAAAHYSKALATIQDDWKRCKPPEFRLGGGRSRR
jgi:hypothetical protein